MKIRIKVIENSSNVSYVLQHKDILGWWNILLKDVWNKKNQHSSDMILRLDDLEKAKKVKSFLEKHKYFDEDMYEIVVGKKPIKITYIL